MDNTKELEEDIFNSSSYKHLFENMLDGFAYCRMLFDEQGDPTDFIYLKVNPAFEKLTGLTSVVDKRVTEVIPNIKKTNPELFTIYGRVATTGKSEQFKISVKSLSLDLFVTAYSDKKGFFVAVFENLTDRDRIQNELNKKIADLDQFNNITVDRELKMVELKKEIKELKSKPKIDRNI